MLMFRKHPKYIDNRSVKVYGRWPEHRIMRDIRWKLLFVTNIIFTSVFVAHTVTIAHNLKYPQYPSVRIIKKHLKDIDFPVSFKICLRKIKDTEKFIKLGYTSMHGFFSGQSRFNDSMIGWNGHTKNYSTLMTIEG